MGDTLDIEETNRLRAALGMPLLPTSNGKSNLEFKTTAAADDEEDGDSDPGSTLDTRHAAAGENWRKLQEEADAKKRKEQKRAQLRKDRDAAQRFAKLEGKGMGEVEDDDMDTRSWLLSSKKRQKKIERERSKMLQRELEERENQALYTEKDLAGRKVAHEVGDFDEGGEHILTLKDAEIGEESEDDELENAELREKQKLEDRLKLKKKIADYDPNAEDDDDGRGVLGKYDEEIDGKKAKRFTLDGFGRTEEEANGTSEKGLSSKGMKFSLDLRHDETPTGDYVDISEIKIKKPKKKKDKQKKQRAADEDDVFAGGDNDTSAAQPAETMDLEEPQQSATNGAGKRKHEDASFADDEDLQSALASQRRLALKKRKRSRPEDLARQIREEASATPAGDEMETNEEEGGLVIDETSEFVANLQKPAPPPTSRDSSTRKVKRETSGPADENGDVPMGEAGANSDSDLDPDAEGTRDAKPEPSATTAAQHTATGLAEEETFNNSGIGATLGMLTKRGLVKAQGGSELNTSQSQQAQFLSHKERLEKEWERRAQEKRKRDREAGLFERMSKRQQEEYAQNENKQRDQFVSRQLGELFDREYKPNVELKYVDEFGRHMDSREAFKQMSHQFHGKMPGKEKTEKRLKRIKEEQEREAKSNLDSGQMSGMSGVAGSQARKQRAAGVRLQ